MLWGASLWVAYDVAVYSIWAVSGAAAFLVGSLIYYFPAVSGAVIDAVIAVLIATVGYNLARFVRRTKLIIESYGGGLSDIERAIERLPSLVAVRQRSERDLYQAKLDELRRAATQAVTGGLELVASATRGARISDAHSGELIITLPMHEISVLSAAFSPDGERIVTALLDRTARIWDARSGQPIAILQGHQGAVESAAFSPDGERIVTASWDNTARIWDARSGQTIATLRGHQGPVESAAFSPDGERIVTASWDNTARIWDARSSQPITTLQGHEGEVPRAAFSPDGTRIVTASWDRTARIWDARSGQPIATLQGHESSVRSAAFSSDGTRIVTASSDCSARIWDVRSGQPIGTLLGHEGPVQSAAFSPDGTRIITASSDRTARIWDARNGQQIATLQGHGGSVRSAAFSPDGAHIVTSSDDLTARIWNARNGERRQSDIAAMLHYLRQLHALRRLILETDASAENTLGQRDDLLEELQQLINEYSSNLAVREAERTERRPLELTPRGKLIRDGQSQLVYCPPHGKFPPAAASRVLTPITRRCCAWFNLRVSHLLLRRRLSVCPGRCGWDSGGGGRVPTVARCSRPFKAPI